MAEPVTDIYKHYGPVIRAWTEAETDATEFGRIGTDVLSDFTRTLVAASATRRGRAGSTRRWRRWRWSP